MPPKRTIKYLVVHHNGVAGRTIEDVTRTHVQEFGWKKIGYHYVIHEDGTIHTGRHEHLPGTHVKGLNPVSMAVCVIGDGNKRDFNQAQYQALIDLLVYWCEKYSLPVEAILGHRETKNLVRPSKATKKTCPGKKVNMDRIRQLVREAREEFELEESPFKHRRQEATAPREIEIELEIED